MDKDRFSLIQGAEVVHDFTHSKMTAMARLNKYFATAMWTDTTVPGRTIYPSEAVREAFKDPKAPVIPLGIPLDGIQLSLPKDGNFVCLGRIAPYKGQELSVRVARENGVQLTVAGHTGQFADQYYGLKVRKACRDAGFEFMADPPDLNGLLDGAAGLLHLHDWIESFSLVAAHALLRGVPVLTTDIGAPQEWVRACDGGMIVGLKDINTGRPEAKAITKAFFETNWSSRREGIAKRARELFDVRVVAEKYLELYGVK